MKLLTVAVLAVLMTAVSLADDLATKPLPEEAKAQIQAAYNEHLPLIVEAGRQSKAVQANALAHTTASSKAELDAMNVALHDAAQNVDKAADALRRACPSVTADKVSVDFVGYIYSAVEPYRFPTPCHLVRVLDDTSCIVTIDGVAFWLHTSSTAALVKSGASDFPYHTRRSVTWGPGNQMYHVTDQTTHPDIGDGKTLVWVAEEVSTAPFSTEARNLSQK